MRPTRKALAASFVVTFAAGCDSKSAQPVSAPTVFPTLVPAAASASASATAAAAGDDGGAPSASGSAAGAVLPPAPPAGRLVHNDDGSCTWYSNRPPRMPAGRVILNPPPPRRVQCPPDDAGP
jgi:hypothetical protein